MSRHADGSVRLQKKQLYLTLQDFAEQLRPHADPTSVLRELVSRGPNQPLPIALATGTNLEVTLLHRKDNADLVQEDLQDTTGETNSGSPEQHGRPTSGVGGTEPSDTGDPTSFSAPEDGNTNDEEGTGSGILSLLGVAGLVLLGSALADGNQETEAPGSPSRGPQFDPRNRRRNRDRTGLPRWMIDLDTVRETTTVRDKDLTDDFPTYSSAKERAGGPTEDDAIVFLGARRSEEVCYSGRLEPAIHSVDKPRAPEASFISVEARSDIFGYGGSNRAVRFEIWGRPCGRFRPRIRPDLQLDLSAGFITPPPISGSRDCR